MQALPMAVMTAIFFILGLMMANWLGLPKSDFRNGFVAIVTLWGVLIGWRIAMVNRRS